MATVLEDMSGSIMAFFGLRFRRATTYVFFRQITLSRRSSIDDDEMCDRESNCRIVIWSTVSHVTNGRQDANFRRQRLSANLFDKLKVNRNVQVARGHRLSES